MSRKERKPLVDTESLLGNVLKRDRALSGREAPESDIAAEQPVQHEEAEPTPELFEKQEAPTPEPPKAKPASNLTDKLTGKPTKRELAAQAKALAESRFATVSLKLPEELNDWVDQYVFEHRKEKVLKQDLISRAIQLLYIEVHSEAQD